MNQSSDFLSLLSFESSSVHRQQRQEIQGLQGKEEVRSLASEVAAKHLAKSSSADQSAVNRVPDAGEGKVERSQYFR